MNAGWDFAMHAFGTMPAWISSILVGWSLSMGITQTVKFWMPLRWDPYFRENMTRGIAILSGAIPAFLYFTSRDGEPLLGALIAAGTGVWSPMFYAFAQSAVRRFFPWWADVWSQDSRGLFTGVRRENPPPDEVP